MGWTKNVFAKLPEICMQFCFAWFIFDFISQLFERAKFWFQLLDSNHTGRISLPQFEDGFEFMGVHPREQDLIDLIDTYGKNGELRFDDFIRMINDVKLRCLRDRMAMSNEQVSLRDIFDIIDSDHNNMITEDEWAHAFWSSDLHTIMR